MRNVANRLSLIVALVLCSCAALASIPCKTSCPGAGWGAIVANMKDRCMCMGGSCFKIDIGYGGPTQTYNGSTKIQADVDGSKYQTKKTTSTKYDKDAMRMRNWFNDKDGKWIHKTNGCTQGGQTRTAGCIGVPCDKWPLMKAQEGKTLVVCGGKNVPDKSKVGIDIYAGKKSSKKSSGKSWWQQSNDNNGSDDQGGRN